MRYRLGVRRYDFDGGLAPYPLQKLPQWQLLTSHIQAVRVCAPRPLTSN